MPDTAPNRFVVQHHTGYGSEHWDLMLEDGDTLACWQLERPPTFEDSQPIGAIRLPNHRKAYLTYQGPVSGGRGIVRIFDAGLILRLEKEPHLWTVTLDGEHLRGAYALSEVSLSEPMGASSAHWVLSR